jgi:phosphate transport system protein
MNRRFEAELNRLRVKLLEMSFAADDAVKKSCEALFTRNEALAKEVIKGDDALNRFQIEIDNRGYCLFALGQPVASELRLVIMILKINTDLERVGDHAVNIAEKSLQVNREPPLKISVPLRKMANVTQGMLRDSLDSFLNENAELAHKVLKSDDEVDRYNDVLFESLSGLMESDKTTVAMAVQLMMISHNLERIADLSLNIAEDVIYLIQGKEVRHCPQFRK